LTPIDKYKFIKNLKSDYEKSIVFVGDGINDAPAMAECDVGIAVESASDITKDAGDIILLNSNLKGVIKAVVLAEKGLKIIKQNLFWAYVYNLIGIPVAAGFLYPIFGILLNPMYAGMTMAFSSITVVLNALRLRRISLE
jgi:ATPase, P-type (transporting), HAD superfamily, subfamily IC